MKNEMKMSIGVGTCSLLMMFIVVTVSAIMALILMASERELRINEKSTAYIKAYYSADAAANVKIIEIKDKLLHMKEETDQARCLSQEKGLFVKRVKEQLWISYELPIIDEQVLSVQLEINLPYKEESKVNIKKWYVCSLAEKQSEDEAYGEIENL